MGPVGTKGLVNHMKPTKRCLTSLDHDNYGNSIGFFLSRLEKSTGISTPFMRFRLPALDQSDCTLDLHTSLSHLTN